MITDTRGGIITNLRTYQFTNLPVYSLSDFIKPFRPLSPIVFQWIGVFELLPRSTAVRAMKYGLLAQQIVVQAGRQRGVRNGDVKPVFARI